MANKTDTAVNLASATEALKGMFVELFPTVSSGTWVSWTHDDQVALNGFMRKLDSVFSKLRPPYDQTVWNGHDSGKVETTIESIRARRAPDAAKPGRKTQPKTVDEIFESL